MPYVDLEAEDDYASIWYTTNTLFSNVGGFDLEKPTIVIIHPTFLCTDWLHNQFGDPRLDESYNLVAFDMRVSGRSMCKPSGKHDSWVDAADLAHCINNLHVPPCHVLALEGPAIGCALRFAALFPALCLSITLCNVPAPTELRWIFNAYDEILQSWCYASDLESFEHAAMEAVKLVIGSECGVDLQDDLIEYWEMGLPPTERVRMLEQMNVLMNRSSLPPEVLKAIRQPVLILHGDRNEACPMKFAERLRSDLCNAQGGAVLFPIKGGAGSISIVPGHASIMHQTFIKFLARLDKPHSNYVWPTTFDLMEHALERLSSLMGDPMVSTRSPLSPLSFSCLSPDVVQSQTESLKTYAKGASKAFKPVGPDGRPIRKYSERQNNHWFHGEKDGLSYAASFMRDKEHDLPLDKRMAYPHDTMSSDAIQGRVRRATITPNIVDKHVIKGSMAKVVEASQQSTLQRMLY